MRISAFCRTTRPVVLPLVLIATVAVCGESDTTPVVTGPIYPANTRMLTFSSLRDGNLEIYAMNVDGSDAQRLTNHIAADHNADWSPDGTRIFFFFFV